MRVLLLAATGNVARRIAGQLSKLAPEVELRLTTSRPEALGGLRDEFPTAEVVIADHYDEDSLKSAIQGVDRISVINPDFTDEKLATANLVAAVESTGNVQQVLRLVTHPPGLSFDALDPELKATRIGLAHCLLARELLEQSGLPVTFVNVVAYYMSNLFWFSDRIRTRSELAIPFPHLSTWIDPEDVAAFHARILLDLPGAHIGNTYVISGEQMCGYEDVANELSRSLGRSIEYSDDEAGIREPFGEEAEIFLAYFSREFMYYANVEPTHTFRDLLGRPPRSLREWLRENASSFE